MIATAFAAAKSKSRWKRDWKIELIERDNPHWVDIYPSLKL